MISNKNPLHVKIKDIEGLEIPKQAYNSDAGYDVITTSDPIIVGELAENSTNIYKRIDYIEYHTKIHLQLPKVSVVDANIYKSEWASFYFHCNLRSRSSIRKYNLILANSIGLADPQYLGEYLFCFKYIVQPEDLVIQHHSISYLVGSYTVGCKINYDKIYKKGDKIGQLEFQPTYFADFNKVKELEQTERGEKGFGSSTEKS